MTRGAAVRDAAVTAAVVLAPAMDIPGELNALVMAVAAMGLPLASGLMEKSTITDPALMELMVTRFASMLSFAATAVVKSASNFVRAGVPAAMVAMATSSFICTLSTTSPAGVVLFPNPYFCADAISGTRTAIAPSNTAIVANGSERVAWRIIVDLIG